LSALSVLEFPSDTFRNAATHQADGEDDADDAKHDGEDVVLCRRGRNNVHVLTDRLQWFPLHQQITKCDQSTY